MQMKKKRNRNCSNFSLSSMSLLTKYNLYALRYRAYVSKQNKNFENVLVHTNGIQ